jgi:PAS domain-containing protein
MDNELSRLVDMVPGLVWTALPDGHVDFLIQRWCEYTGLSVAEACGRGGRLCEFTRPNQRRGLIASPASQLRSQMGLSVVNDVGHQVCEQHGGSHGHD